MRPCEIKGADGSVCTNSPGGVISSLVAKLSDIASITFTADKITAIAMATGKSFEEWVYADNNVATYVETPPTRDNALSTQTLTGQFYSVNSSLVEVADGANQCCEGIVAVHQMGDGTLRVQGIERYLATGAKVWRPSVNKMRAFFGTDHQTVQGKPVTTVTGDSAAWYLAPYVADTLTYAAIKAL